MLYTDVFTTIHKHPLFITPSCRTTFCLLAHISLLQYSISSNVLAFRSTLEHISVGYPCISSSWTQWVKNNNRPNYSQELKGVLAWPSSHYSNFSWSFFFLHEESCSSWCHGNFNLFLIYLYIIIIIFFINLKDVCVNVVYGNAHVLDKDLNLLWLGFLGMVIDTLLAFHINLITSKCYMQHAYGIFLSLINFSNTWRVSMCSG